MVTEAAAMAKSVDGVILIVRQNHTISESVERARNNLKMANAKILGYVLNGVDGQTYGYGAYGSRTVKRYGGYEDSSYSKSSSSYSYGYKDKRRNKDGKVAKKEKK